MKRERPIYSRKFLQDFGAGLTREELRLVQAFRGLSAPKQEALLTIASHCVVERAKKAAGGVH